MAVRRKRKLRKPAPARVRRRYAPDVLRLAAAWEARVRVEYYRALAQVLPRVREALIRQGARRDAVDTDELLRGLNASPAPEDLLRRLFNQVDDEGERKLRARLPGVALPDVLRGGPRLQQQWVRANVDLIKVPDRIKSVLRKELAGPLDAGVRVEDLMQQLQERFNLDARRAELIARDQTLKLSGQLQEERQLQAGIKRYVWTTSGDERVRHDHAELDGKTFEWDDPPITNASEVARGRPPRRNNPGGDYQCRCSADPAIDDLADEPTDSLEPLSVSNGPAFGDVTPAQRSAPFTRPAEPEFIRAEREARTAPVDLAQHLAAQGESTVTPEAQEALARVFGKPPNAPTLDAITGRAAFEGLPGARIFTVSATTEGGVKITSIIGDKKHIRMVRTFNRVEGKLVAMHDYVSLPEALQGSGVGRKLMAAQLAAYEAAGVARVELDAAWVGRYYWSKLGFNVSAEEFAVYHARFTKYLTAKVGESAAVEIAKQAKTMRDIARVRVGDRALGKDFFLGDVGPDGKRLEAAGGSYIANMSLPVKPGSKVYETAKRELSK